ncbi:uncharacterized protein LOC141640720 [Silene latifolia]|uniref:uncharacterized protein LOC141640720 n=1 Tax=Silene latifolia TaxID=37657 RepID=UPI003D77174A
MSLLCYNCRGLGNDPAFVRLRGLLRGEKAEVVVLMETKLGGQEMQRVIQRLGGDYVGVGIDSIGRSAGMAILWKEGVDVEIISSTAHHIDVVVRGLFNLNEWRLTGIYGWSNNEEKWRTWQLMRDIKPLSTLPWLMIGDYNQILFEHEKKGGPPREQRLMDEFREAMNDCELLDIGFSGNNYTWWNRRSGPAAVYERLDRALATVSFLEACPMIQLSHLDFDKSDHVPLKLAMFSPEKVRKGKRFRFEDMWAQSEDCEDVVRDSWAAGSSVNVGHVALSKLNFCSRKSRRME